MNVICGYRRQLHCRNAPFAASPSSCASVVGCALNHRRFGLKSCRAIPAAGNAGPITIPEVIEIQRGPCLPHWNRPAPRRAASLMWNQAANRSQRDRCLRLCRPSRQMSFQRWHRVRSFLPFRFGNAAKPNGFSPCDHRVRQYRREDPETHGFRVLDRLMPDAIVTHGCAQFRKPAVSFPSDSQGVHSPPATCLTTRPVPFRLM